MSSNTVEEKIYLRQLYKQKQEGVALRQTDQTRHFDGVAGDKGQQGELFGFRNLLAFQAGDESVLERSDTKAILQKGLAGFETVGDGVEAQGPAAPISMEDGGGGGGGGGGDDDDSVAAGLDPSDLFVVRQDPTLIETASDEEEGGEEDESGEADQERDQLLSLLGEPRRPRGRTKKARRVGASSPQGGGEEAEEEAEEEVHATLRQTVHTVDHMSLLGGAKLRAQHQPDKGAGGAGAGVADEIEQRARSEGLLKRKAAAGVGAEAGAAEAAGSAAAKVASEEEEEGDASDAGTPVSINRARRPPKPAPTDFVPRDLRDCLCGCRTYEEYTRRVQDAGNPIAAWRYMYARVEWGREAELCELIEELPEEREAAGAVGA